MTISVLEIELLLGAALLGVALGLGSLPYWQRRKLKSEALRLWQKWENILCSMDPDIYRRPTRLEAFVEPVASGLLPWRKHYQILVKVCLSRDEDLPRVRLLTEHCVKEFLELPGCKRLLVRTYYMKFDET